MVGIGTAGSGGDGGQSTAATVNYPFGLFANATWLYVAEDAGARLRRVDLTSGIITTVLGTGSTTGSFLGVAPTSSNLGILALVVVLPNGHLAAGGGSRCTVVGVHPATQLTYSVAGTGTCLSAGAAAGEGVSANTTAFGSPRYAVAWGSDGLFISTAVDNRVRLVNLTTGASLSEGGGGEGGDDCSCSPSPCAGRKGVGLWS
jgi:hypothetical protein